MSQTVEGTEHRAFIKLLCLPKAVIISIIDYNGRLVDIVQLDAAMQSSTVLAGPWREAIKGTRPLTFNSRRYTRVEEIRWVLKREADLKNFELSMPGIGGMTSLGWVVREGHTDIAEAIVVRELNGLYI